MCKYNAWLLSLSFPKRFLHHLLCALAGSLGTYIQAGWPLQRTVINARADSINQVCWTLLSTVVCTSGGKGRLCCGGWGCSWKVLDASNHPHGPSWSGGDKLGCKSWFCLCLLTCRRVYWWEWEGRWRSIAWGWGKVVGSSINPQKSSHRCCWTSRDRQRVPDMGAEHLFPHTGGSCSTLVCFGCCKAD